MDSTNKLVDFSIFGDYFDLDSFTEQMGIVPSEVYNNGDLIRGNLFRKETCWSISTGYEESLDINDQLKKIIKLIKPKKDRFLNFIMQ